MTKGDFGGTRTNARQRGKFIVATSRKFMTMYPTKLLLETEKDD